MSKKKKNITFLFAAVFTPPFTGQTMATEFIYNQAQKSGAKTVKLKIKARAGGRIKIISHIIKAITTFWAAIKILFVFDTFKLYYCPNATSGQVIDLIFTLTARWKGKWIVHHHVASYINTPSKLSLALFKLMPRDTVHIFSCPSLRDNFKKHYPMNNSMILPLSFMANEIEFSQVEKKNKIYTIGHLSNLTTTKGLDTVIEISRGLESENTEHVLLLAGPYADAEAKSLVEEALKENLPIKYLGPVYGKAKIDYFKKLDLFLFPTRYKNETWGIVLSEATATGVPSLTRALPCVAQQVQSDFVIPTSTESETELKEFLSKTKWLEQVWRTDSTQFNKIRSEVRKHFDTLNKTSTNNINKLVTET